MNNYDARTEAWGWIADIIASVINADGDSFADMDKKARYIAEQILISFQLKVRNRLKSKSTKSCKNTVGGEV